jgi:hypothetical protein
MKGSEERVRYQESEKRMKTGNEKASGVFSLSAGVKKGITGIKSLLKVSQKRLNQSQEITKE